MRSAQPHSRHHCDTSETLHTHTQLLRSPHKSSLASGATIPDSGLRTSEATMQTAISARTLSTAPSRVHSRMRSWPHRWLSRTRTVHIDAYQEGPDKDKPAKQGTAQQDKVQKLVEEFAEAGVTQSKAKDLLKRWSELGADDPKQLRKLLLRRTGKPITSLVIQTLLDAAAASGGFFCGFVVGSAEEFPFQIGVELVAYFVACYYAIQVAFEVGTLATILFTVAKYGAEASELLAAVQQLAGPGTGLGIADKAALAVNSFKIVQILDAIAEELKERYPDDQQHTTLENLRAYLTYTRAQEQYGFDAAAYGLTEQRASNIALAFSNYDLNDDGKLELSELRKLCESLNHPLADEELREAIRILDTNENGYIEFTEFVAWWVKETREGKTPLAPEDAASESAAA